MDYLHERQHKRELRLESAQKATGIAEAESQQLDLERTMLFGLADLNRCRRPGGRPTCVTGHARLASRCSPSWTSILRSVW
jgi:hypothetical protein